MTVKSNEYQNDAADSLYMTYEEGSKYVVFQSSGGRPVYLARQKAERLADALLLWIATRDEQGVGDCNG